MKKSSARLVWDTKNNEIPAFEDSGFSKHEIISPEGGKHDETWHNRLIQGDNLPVMRKLLKQGLEEKINLIYIDPPFMSQSDYRQKILSSTGSGESALKVAFSDRWTQGMDSYLDMLFPRLRIMKMLLADSGCIFVHLDCHMSHYVKVLMDEIFGHENFRNEIIWHYRTYQGNVSKHFPKKHDTILFYSKSNKYFFRLLKEKDFTKNIDYVRWKKYLVNECEIRGDNYPGTDSRFDVFLKKWKKEHGNMLPSKNDVIYRLEGFTVDSVWDIKNVDPKSSNRFYITQKPEEIAVRIIESATQECDIVADFFAGSGTTLAAAEKMQRRWIGCEAGEIGIRTAMKRLIPIIRRPFVLEKMKI